ncbi:hypothetical protein Droror1_Dr00002870 [Drosera rotundifolia]
MSRPQPRVFSLFPATNPRRLLSLRLNCSLSCLPFFAARKPPVLIGGVEEQRLSPVVGEERNSCSRLGTTVARRSTASGETASSSSRSDAPDPRWLGAGCEEEASSGGDWVVDGLEATAG